MLKAGLATVYEAKSGAEFGVGLEEKYRKAEWWAKLKKRECGRVRARTLKAPGITKRDMRTSHSLKLGRGRDLRDFGVIRHRVMIPNCLLATTRTSFKLLTKDRSSSKIETSNV